MLVVEPQLRKMTVADVDAVLLIEQQIHSHPWTRGMFEGSLAQGHQCWIYVADDAMVGYAILMPGVGEIELLDIGIARAYQGKGLGFKLLNIIKELYLIGEFKRMLLEVRRSNAAATALYRKAGFVEIGVRRGYYPSAEGREDAIVMEYIFQ